MYPRQCENYIVIWNLIFGITAFHLLILIPSLFVYMIIVAMSLVWCFGISGLFMLLVSSIENNWEADRMIGSLIGRI
jgi:hypothetical protein